MEFLKGLKSDDWRLLLLLLVLAAGMTLFVAFMRVLDKRIARRKNREKFFDENNPLGFVLLYLLPIMLSVGCSKGLHTAGVFGNWWWMAGGFIGAISPLLFKFRRIFFTFAGWLVGVVKRLVGAVAKKKLGEDVTTPVAAPAPLKDAPPAPPSSDTTTPKLP